MTNEEVLSVAAIVERATNRFHQQAADHERQLAEHRAAFGARTEADAKIIAALREEVELANGECNVLRALTVDTAKYKANSDLFYNEQKRRMDAEKERDALQAEVADLRGIIAMVHASLGIEPGDHIGQAIEALKSLSPLVDRSRATHAVRAEVAALQDRLRAAQMEVAALKSQTPKHPVKVGEYVKRLTGFNTTPAGEIGRVTRVDDDAEIEYEVKRPDGETGVWIARNCEPCDPPEATHAEPDLTQLHAKGKEAWSDVPNATQWVEEMRGNTEATHDTEAGKAAAAAAVKTEPVADEIKVGDVVEVVSNRGRNTWLADVGSLGTVTGVEEINESISVHLDVVPGKKNALAGYVSLCDVRKVTT